MSKACLRTGDKAAVHFRFIKTPEYLHCEHKLVFREGRTKAVGTVTKVQEAACRWAGHVSLHSPRPPSVSQLLQASKAQQARTPSSKRKDGASAPEEARPPSPNTAQLQVSRRWFGLAEVPLVPLR